PGAPSLLVHYKDTLVRKVMAENRAPHDLAALAGERRYLPYCSVELQADDVFLMRFGGGGGYGDPLQRDALQVVKDIHNGLVSPTIAETLYGVVVSEVDELDPVGTKRKRAALRSERLSAADEPGRSGTRLRDLVGGPQITMTDADPLEEYLVIHRRD